ncbi:MAG: tetratricopeptide repeat protein [Myxococcota bacterium]|nr:tetratricopeptide repeat protein [Myxococcota bacterium]
MRRKTLVAAVGGALLSLLAPLPRGLAQDDDPEVTAMAKQHFKLGLEAYNAGKYDLAIKELKKAYLLKRLPAILFNIGLTYRKMKDYDLAVYFYRKFLAEAPPEDKQRAMAEQAIQEIEAEKAAAMAPEPRTPVEAVPAARPKEAAPSGPAAPSAPSAPSGPAAPALPAMEWTHTPIDAVPPGKPVDVRVQMPVMKGVKVKVYFRKEGQATFDVLELKRRGNEKVARLPASVSTGRTFQYYIEARDAAGTLIKSSGSEASPNIVLVDPAARPQLAGAEAEGPDEEELAARRKPGFTRDIENEQATFDRSAQEGAMARLREQMRRQETTRAGRSPLGRLGWVGVGMLGGGGLIAAGGLTLLGLAQHWAAVVTDDWECRNRVRPPGGMLQCPHFGGNETRPGYALNPPTAVYDNQGRAFDAAGTALTVVGGVAAAAGAGLLVADLLRRGAAERTSAKPQAAPSQRRKVKKASEEEEEQTTSQLHLSPVVAPTTVGLVAELRF